MRCIFFSETTVPKAVDLYNKWAAGKPLTRDVLVHEFICYVADQEEGGVCIMVYFDEKLHPNWVGKDDTQV